MDVVGLSRQGSVSAEESGHMFSQSRDCLERVQDPFNIHQQQRMNDFGTKKASRFMDHDYNPS